jgi:hypothetical protein
MEEAEMGAGTEPVDDYDPLDDARKSYDVAIAAMRDDLLKARNGLAYARHVPGETVVEVCLLKDGTFSTVAIDAVAAITVGGQLVTLGLAALRSQKV